MRAVPALTALAACDPTLARLIEVVGPCGLAPDRAASPYRHLARAIAHQQLNGTAANTILGRLVAIHHPDDPLAFPTPQQLLATPETQLRAAGFSRAKAAALLDLAAKTIAGVVPDTAALDPLDDAQIVAQLTAVRGIGRWTVEMMLMFQLGRPDVLPVDDFGVRNGFRLAYGLRALPPPRALALYGERWAPHRSAAAGYLGRAVDLAKEGRLPPPLRPAPRLRGGGAKRRSAPATRKHAAPVSRAAASAVRRRPRGARTR
ncbi:MAG: DNA-3-methyladenine glycosylase 2 family protein [Steroidobacteraceae bacterium]